MSNDESSQLTKVRIETRSKEDHNQLDKEILWAMPLGNQLYRLENVSFYSFDLNLHDIVRCRESDDDMPVVTELVQASGCKTLRVIFGDETSEENCVDIIWELRYQGINYEKFYFKCYGFVVEPNQDYEAVHNYLQMKEEEGYLWLYETEE
jgi:hypothetical protein